MNLEGGGAERNSVIVKQKLKEISSAELLLKINVPIFCTGIEENLFTSLTKFFSIFGTEFNNPSTRASLPAILSREIDLP